MKTLTILALLLQAATPSTAQSVAVVNNTVSFSYDSNGNTVSRKSKSQLPEKADFGGDSSSKLPDDILVKWESNVLTVTPKSTDKSIVDLSLYDSKPVLLMQESFSDGSHSVDMNDYPDGTYVFGIRYKENNYSKKVMKTGKGQ